MKGLLKGLEKLNSITFMIEKWVLIAAVISMVAINFAQVVCRYIFHYSIPWSEQTSVVLFMFMVLLGGNLAMKEDNEIKIEIIKFKDPRKDAAFRLISDVIAVVTLGLLAASAILISIQGVKNPQVLSAIPLKYYHLYLMMTVGFSLMFVEKCTNIVKKIVFLQNNETKGEVME